MTSARRHSPSEWPFGQALLKGRVCHSELGCPLAERLALAAPFDHAVASLVSALADRRGPPTIPRAVPLAVVDAVKARSRRLDTHVRKKVSKGPPPLAHHDASAPVVCKMPVLRIRAPLRHPDPRVIGGGGLLPRRGVAVLGAPRDRDVASQAAARLRSGVPQHDTIHDADRPAFAPAAPHGSATRRVLSPLDYSPAAYTLARQVDRSHHWNIAHCKGVVQ